MRQLGLITGVLIFLAFWGSTRSLAQCTNGVKDSFLTTSCAPATVVFECCLGSAQNQLQSCVWTFPNGTTSSAISTFYTFTSGGTYVITGVATLKTGPTQNISATVTILNKPKPCYTITPLGGCSPLTIHYCASCTSGGTPPYTYFWDFENGDTSGLQCGNYTYTGIAGVRKCYDPLLIITDKLGCEADTAIGKDSVCLDAKPTVCFTTSTAATKCSLPDTICFTNCSTDVNSKLTYLWSFPGGNITSSTAQTPPCVVYKQAGAYSPSLTATDANGCSASETQTNLINAGNGVTSFTQSADSICLGNNSFSVDASPAGTSGTYLWSCTPGPPSSDVLNPDSETTNIIFTKQGDYAVSLTEHLQAGCVVSHSSTVFVSDTPSALFVLTPDSVTGCKPPLTLTVQNKTTPNISKWSYIWDFSGAVTAINPPPITTPFKLTYDYCGSYGITLTAINTIGCSSTWSQQDAADINCPSGTITMDTLIPPICVPLTVKFKAHPSGNPKDYTYAWDLNYTSPGKFGAGATADSAINDPIKIVGCDTVAVKMTNNLGCTVVVTAPPVCVGQHSDSSLDFTVTPDTACATKMITFTVNHQPLKDSCQTTYTWFFGDGSNKLVLPPGKAMHQYTDTGCFEIKLIRCNCQCCDTLIKKASVCIEPPIVKLSLTRLCASPLCINLSTTGSIGVDSFHWDIDSLGAFVIDSISNTPIDSSFIRVCFPNANSSYKVCVTGYNKAFGCNQRVCATAQTTDPLPSFHFSDSTRQCLDSYDSLCNTSVGCAKFMWTITDELGNPVLTSTLPGLTSPNLCGSYKFPYPGRFTICLEGIDVGGCTKTLCKPAYVNVYGLNVGFEPTPPYGGCPPFAAHFADTTKSNPFSQYVSSDWNFGDIVSGASDSSTLQNPTHVYNARGSYIITLCDKDNSGCISCVSLPQNINVSQPLVNFSPMDSFVCRKDSACMLNNSTGEGPSYSWSLTNSTGQIINTSDSTNPCFYVTMPGNFKVKLIAVDTLGCKDSLTRQITVGNLIANFGAAGDTSTKCPPFPVSFSFLFAPGADTTNLTYFWEFGDGATSTDKSPSHTYVYSDSFRVTLVVKDPATGCTDSLTKNPYIIVGGPRANIEIEPDTGCAPLTVLFHLVSGSSVNYLWDFGDGSPLVSSLGDTTHIYLKPNTVKRYWSPSVFLNDGKNCTYTLILKNIYVDSAFARFALSSLSVCSGGSVTLTDSSYTVLGSESCLWNFGDGTPPSKVCNTAHTYDNAGTFAISLTINTPAGCVSTATDSIVVKPTPHASLVATKNAICPGDTICFSSNSTSVSPIVSFYWFFGDTLSLATDTSTLPAPCHQYQTPGNYVAVLLVGAANLCTDTMQYHIHVNTPQGNAGQDTAVCFLDSIQLHATGGESYQWSPPTGLSATNISNPYVSPATVTTYTVVVTDNTGCTAKDSLVVSIHPLPRPLVTYKDSTCLGLSDTLSASGGVSYLWSTGQTNQVIAPVILSNDTFTVTVTDIHHCSADTSANVVVKPLPDIITNGNDTAVCKGDTIQLHASGGILYSWTSASGGIIIGNADTSAINAEINDTTIFTVSVTNNFKCTTSAQVEVNKLPLPDVSAGPDIKMCSGDTVQLHGSGAVKYIWSPQCLFRLCQNNVQNPFAVPDSPLYKIQVVLKGIDKNGCANYDTTYINVLYRFKIKVTPDTCICNHDCATLHVLTDTPKNYIWSPLIAIQNANTATPLVCPVDTITYTVIVSDGLCYSDTGSVTVCVNPLPQLTAYPHDTLILSGAEATLFAYSESAGSYKWLPNSSITHSSDTYCDTCKAAIAQPDYITTYTVTITDLNGCRAEDSSVVNVFCSDASIFIPNAFSPNGDGKNDVFLIEGEGFTLKDLRIYNRWGKEVFESHDISQGWNGYVDGKLSDPNVFVYYLEAICSSGTVISKKGNITLVR